MLRAISEMADAKMEQLADRYGVDTDEACECLLVLVIIIIMLVICL